MPDKRSCLIGRVVKRDMAYLFIILSVCAGLAEGFLIKEYNKKYEKGGFIFTAIVSLCAMIYFVIYDLIVDDAGLIFLPEMLPYAIIAGILYCAASVLTYYALQIGSFALTMLILSYSLVFSVLYGLLFLHEPATPFTYIGFGLMVLSIFFFRGKEEQGKEKKKFSFLWLICITISVIGSGMFGVLSRMQQIRFNDTVTNEFMALALGISAMVLFAVGFIKDKKDCFYILKKGSCYAFGAGIANGVKNMLSNVVYMMIAISISAPTSAGIRIVITFLLSYFVFKEKFLKRQVVGVVLGAIAVVLLNI